MSTVQSLRLSAFHRLASATAACGLTAAVLLSLLSIAEPQRSRLAAARQAVAVNAPARPATTPGSAAPGLPTQATRVAAR